MTRRVPYSVEQRQNSGSEVVWLERLRDEGVRASFVCLTPRLLLGMSGEDHHRDVGSCLVGPNLVEDLPTVHTGQPDVKDDQVGSLLADGLKPARAIVTRDYLEVGRP